MKVRTLHPWGVTTGEARDLQRKLAPMVCTSNMTSTQVRYFAGLDLSPPDQEGIVRGAAVVLSYPDLEVMEVGIAEGKPQFPYIPGLLSFRECPVLVSALEQLTTTPDIIFADGQGLAHPRRFGLACHIGLITGIPTIGCAKSLLLGVHGLLGDDAGAHAELVHASEVVGMALRTRANVRPVYVSVGHNIDLASAVRWVLACCLGKRLPEATRLAHQAAAGKPMPIKLSSTPVG